MDKTLWPATTATIYSCGWQDTPWYFLGSGNYLIVFSYKVDGNHYSGEYYDVEAATGGSQFSLRYNPDNPEENEKSLRMKWVRWLAVAAFALVPAAFVVYGWYRGWK
jgi:hypothetical protein